MDHFHTRVPFNPKPIATSTGVETATIQPDAAADSVENKHPQHDAAALPLHAAAGADYIISVDQVRARLAEHGVQKSKDTIQRWCRSGELDCKKLGIFNRHFTTEESLVALEKRLLPDMVADRLGETNPPPSTFAAEGDDGAEKLQLHETVNTDERSGTQLHADTNAAAHSRVQEVMPPDAAARSGAQEHPEIREENAALKAEVKVLREMIGKFEKFTDQAVADKQMTLETFQTMALGGRLERKNRGASDGEVIHATTPIPNQED